MPAQAPSASLAPQAPYTPSQNLQAWASAYFVLVWGAGFVATRVALQYAAPFSYIGVRYGLATGVALAAALLSRARWPRSPTELGHVLVAGLLAHAGYLGGSHYAQHWGLSAGVTALVLALQPILTALIAARWLGEQLTRWQQAGVVIGFTGVGLVVAHKFDFQALSLGSLLCVLWALICVTAGALYQRHFCRDSDLRSSVVLHFAATSALMLPLGAALEGFAIHWVWPLAGTLLYHVLLASIGAYTVFHLLMRHGQATGVTSLLYLTPPVAVACEWLLFGVLPTGLSLLGMGLTCLGVAWVTRRTAPLAARGTA